MSQTSDWVLDIRVSEAACWVFTSKPPEILRSEIVVPFEVTRRSEAYVALVASLNEYLGPFLRETVGV